MTANDVASRVLYSDLAARAVLAPIATAAWRAHATGRSSPATARAGYRAMRKLFGAPTTRHFERLVDLAAQERPLLDLPAAPSGVASGVVDEVVDRLRDDGYAILPSRLPEADCADLEAVARQSTCSLVGPAGAAGRGRFDEDRPDAVRYDLDEQDVLRSAAAQRIVVDESLLCIAQAYLGAPPIQDLVAMWWSAAVGDGASAAAAQKFHFDLDRLRFLKVFVFLTDVDEDTGPHVYVRGSHRALPQQFRADGRHEDREVEAAFPDDVVSITGPRGTVFLADTKGLHKGQGLRRGHRLVFQTEYCSSLFGSPYTTPRLHTPIRELVDAVKKYPWVFQRFLDLP